MPVLSSRFRHNFMHVLAVLVACAVFCVTMLFTSGALGHRLGLFVNTPGGFAEKFYLEKYKLEVTPADWVFYMSAVIYLWQSMWLTYGVACLFRRTEHGYLYVVFPVLPPIFYIVFAFSLACNINWLLIWERQYMEVALLFVNLMSFTLYVCLVVSLRRLDQFCSMFPVPVSGVNSSVAGSPADLEVPLSRDVWLVRLLVQNGIAMFAMWGTVASMFNFAVVLTYRTGARQSVSSSVSLSIFTIEIIFWWIFDNFVFERYLRYLVTPYLVIILSIAGIISKNWDPNNANAVYTLVLFLIVMMLTVSKLVLLGWRHKHIPLHVIRDYDMQDEEIYEQPNHCYTTDGPVAAAAGLMDGHKSLLLLNASNS